MGGNNMGSGFNNNMNGFGSSNSAGMDALSQAYSGIQQYAGLSGLVNQGKGSFYASLYSLRCPFLVPTLGVGYRFATAVPFCVMSLSCLTLRTL
jgi:hypothetical protein